MNQTDHGIGEGHARHCCGDLHLASGQEIFPVLNGTVKIGGDKPYGMQGERISHGVSLKDVKRLHSMGERIHPGKGRDSRRKTGYHVGIENGHVGSEVVIKKEDFLIAIVILHHGGKGHFASGSGSCRDRGMKRLGAIQHLHALIVL